MQFPAAVICSISFALQGSYRKPKVLNVLEFYDFIRVPLNDLEFVLNVLEVFESCYKKNIIFFCKSMSLKRLKT